MKKLICAVLALLLVTALIPVFSAGAESVAAPKLFGVQETAVDTATQTQSVRFVSMTGSLACEKLGYEIIAEFTYGDKARSVSYTLESDTVLKKLTVPTGVGGYSEIEAPENKYIFVASIKGVPADIGDIVFSVKTYSVCGGEKTFSDSAIKLLYTNGCFVSEVKPNPTTGSLDSKYIGASDAGEVVKRYYPDIAATQISSLSEITDPAGNYCLSGNIDDNTTTVSGFTGTFDGNGYMITSNVPLFNELAGTVKNLSLAGTLNPTGSGSAALCLTLGNATVRNVKVTTAIEVTDTGTSGIAAAGFAHTANGSAVLENCEFAGSIVNVKNSSGNNRKTAGFIFNTAATAKITFSYCTNSGKITASSHLAGYVAEISGGAELTVAGCLNSGDITGTQEGECGGILGFTAGSSKAVNITLVNCRNTGNISAKKNAAGIYSRSSNTAAASEITVSYCKNEGTVSAGAMASGVCAQFNVGKTVISYCENNAAITTAGNNYAAGILGYIAERVEITGCVNNGKITADSVDNKHIGGILGCCTKNGAKITACVNNGDISLANSSSVSYRVGGIVGSATSSGANVSDITYCLNTGNITVGSPKASQPAGGIAGYLSGNSIVGYCGNTGDITTGGGYVGGMIGYINGTGFTVEYCYNSGVFSGSVCAEMAINNNASNPTTLSDCYYPVKADAAPFIYNAAAGAVIETAGSTAFEAADLTNGNLCAQLNTAAGKTVFEQSSAGYPVPVYSAE